MNRRTRAKQVRRKRVVELAAYSRRYTVNNCTIPKADESQLIELECPWNKNRKLVGTKDTEKWDANKWYKDQRKSAKDARQKSTYSEKNPSGKYKYKGKEKPWYMLDTRKRYHYEERNKSWGKMTDFFRVPSEYAELYNKTVPNLKRGFAWTANKVVNWKLEKWEKKNPCPVKVDQNQQDLFEKEYLIPWKEERAKAEERIRDFVVSVYDKLPLTGRFKKTDTDFTEQEVAKLKDYNGDGHKINEVNPEKSRLIKTAQKVTNELHAKNTKLVCTNLRDHKRQKGRIILPKAA